ncbi:MAG TPA: CVNH domain-containing protein [Candidatus Angelobacter sp.]|jgi:hypothetical protein
MRYLTGLGIAVLALVIGWPWLHSAAQPGGTYRETCRDIGVRGSTLFAKCKDTNNEWHDTRLDNYDRCHGVIQNLNGRLSCTEQRGGSGYGHGHGYGGPSAPRDTYRQTCRDIRTDGNTLNATCQKVDGGWRDTSLKDFNRCKRIVNEDGHLRCTG